MQALLNDIELDLQELKYLLDMMSKELDSPLRNVAKRSILQMRAHLDVMLQQIEENATSFVVPQSQKIELVEEQTEMEVPISKLETVEEKMIIAPTDDLIATSFDKSIVDSFDNLITTSTDSVVTPVSDKTVFTPILGERIRPGEDLRRAISLNDSFRFSRELFGGDSELMNRMIQQIGEMNSLETAIIYLSSKIKVNQEDEAMNDFLELLKKYFKSA